MLKHAYRNRLRLAHRQRPDSLQRTLEHGQGHDGSGHARENLLCELHGTHLDLDKVCRCRRGSCGAARVGESCPVWKLAISERAWRELGKVKCCHSESSFS